MTGAEARELLRPCDGLGDWIARQARQPAPGGWSVRPRLQGWRFRLEAVPKGLRVTAGEPGAGGVVGTRRGDVYLKQLLRPTGRMQATQSSLGLSCIVQCSIGLYLCKRQQPSVAGLLPFLDVSSLNSAAPRGAALFLPTPGGRVVCLSFHGSKGAAMDLRP